MKSFKFQYTVFLGLLVALINIQASSEVVEASFWVAANCEHCAERIEEAVDVKGVKSADFDLETNMLNIVYKPEVIKLTKLHELVAAAGHDTKRVKASESAYNSIEKECCKYRGEQKSSGCSKSCSKSCTKKK